MKWLVRTALAAFIMIFLFVPASAYNVSEVAESFSSGESGEPFGYAMSAIGSVLGADGLNFMLTFILIFCIAWFLFSMIGKTVYRDSKAFAKISAPISIILGFAGAGYVFFQEINVAEIVGAYSLILLAIFGVIMTINAIFVMLNKNFKTCGKILNFGFIALGVGLVFDLLGSKLPISGAISDILVFVGIILIIAGIICFVSSAFKGKKTGDWGFDFGKKDKEDEREHEKEESLDVDFDVSPAGGESPLEVAITNNSSGDIQKYEWDFGNGKTSDSKNPGNITYSISKRKKFKEFKITLKIKGKKSSKTTSQKVFVTSKINADEDITPDFSITPSSLKEGESFEIKDNSGKDVKEWEWKIYEEGDSSNVIDEFTGKGPHKKEAPKIGNEIHKRFVVELKVKGEISEKVFPRTFDVYRDEEEIKAGFEIKLNNEYPLELDFKNTSSGPIDTYVWDYGDGDVKQTSDFEPPIKRKLYYVPDGEETKSFKIKLTVYSGNRENSYEEIILVSRKHEPIVDLNPDFEINPIKQNEGEKVSIKYTGNKSVVSDIFWEVKAKGAGRYLVINEDDFDFDFETENWLRKLDELEYEIRVTVKGENSEAKLSRYFILVKKPEKKYSVDFRAEPGAIIGEGTISFFNESDDDILKDGGKFKWFIDGKEVSGDFNCSHNFTYHSKDDIEQHDVRLVAYDKEGIEIGSDSHSIYVLPPEQEQIHPEIDIVKDNEGFAPCDVTFDSSKSTPQEEIDENKTKWTVYNDENNEIYMDTGPKISINFSEEGTYLVKLELFRKNGEKGGEASRNFKILPTFNPHFVIRTEEDGPDLGISAKVYSGQEFILDARRNEHRKLISKYDWYIEDENGNPSVNVKPTRNPVIHNLKIDKTGKYKVTLVIYIGNKRVGASSKELIVLDKGLEARINIDKKSDKVPTEVEFENVSVGGPFKKVEWECSDGRKNNEKEKFKLNFDKPGKYFMRLTVVNELGKSDTELESFTLVTETKKTPLNKKYCVRYVKLIDNFHDRISKKQLSKKIDGDIYSKINDLKFEKAIKNMGKHGDIVSIRNNTDKLVRGLTRVKMFFIDYAKEGFDSDVFQNYNKSSKFERDYLDALKWQIDYLKEKEGSEEEINRLEEKYENEKKLWKNEKQAASEIIDKYAVNKEVKDNQSFGGIARNKIAEFKNNLTLKEQEVIDKLKKKNSNFNEKVIYSDNEYKKLKEEINKDLAEYYEKSIGATLNMFNHYKKILKCREFITEYLSNKKSGLFRHSFLEVKSVLEYCNDNFINKKMTEPEKLINSYNYAIDNYKEILDSLKQESSKLAELADGNGITNEHTDEFKETFEYFNPKKLSFEKDKNYSDNDLRDLREKVSNFLILPIRLSYLIMLNYLSYETISARSMCNQYQKVIDLLKYMFSDGFFGKGEMIKLRDKLLDRIEALGK